MRESKRPVLPDTSRPEQRASADITADILTPQPSPRGTLKIAPDSLASLLAADRKESDLSHPWFSSELSETAVDQLSLEEPEPELATFMSAGAAILAATELLVLFVMFG